MRSDRSPAYCHACGSRLTPGDSYCSNCGTRVDRSGARRGTRADRDSTWGRRDSRGRHDSTGGRYDEWPWSGRRERSHTDRGTRRFRERVADLQAKGWDVIEDTGDRVILANRSIGSIPIHILLLLFTSGIGNLLYAWYAYDIAPPRIEVHTDGTERYIDGHDPDDASGAITVLVGLFVGFVLVSMLFSLALVGTPVMFVFTMVILTLGILGLTYGYASDTEGESLLPDWVGRIADSIRARADDFRAATESIGTFGRKRSVSEREAESIDARCTICGEPVLDGVERTFADRFYVAGLPLRTYDVGTNEYCPECAHGDAYESTAPLDRSIERELSR